MIARILALSFVLALFGVGGCGGDDDDSDGASETTPTETTAADTGATTTPAAAGGNGTEVKVADSQYGKILFDGKDQAIYLFDRETSAKPDCYGECATAWPPVLTEGQPTAGAGADAAKLGTTKRTDGKTQVTYNGHPLYYYEDDPPGKVLCHNVDEFGGLWLVVQPSGEAAPA